MAVPCVLCSVCLRPGSVQRPFERNLIAATDGTVESTGVAGEESDFIVQSPSTRRASRASFEQQQPATSHPLANTSSANALSFENHDNSQFSLRSIPAIPISSHNELKIEPTLSGTDFASLGNNSFQASSAPSPLQQNPSLSPRKASLSSQVIPNSITLSPPSPSSSLDNSNSSKKCLRPWSPQNVNQKPPTPAPVPKFISPAFWRLPWSSRQMNATAMADRIS
ncbi:unnamed protein product [Protopolystoma xenopodis]|uniref:Uncharacterized protein n=1 Tax=Protopolystoma xenopodis TaxID=117903 RepID=A0A448WAF1_9PLAT|nr:unnamed protein product [Protopolystoma xenopodis]